MEKLVILGKGNPSGQTIGMGMWAVAVNIADHRIMIDLTTLKLLR
jgi:hypothetical protein